MAWYTVTDSKLYICMRYFWQHCGYILQPSFITSTYDMSFAIVLPIHPKKEQSPKERKCCPEMAGR